MSRQQGNEWPGQGGGYGECVKVPYEQTVKERVAGPYRRG